MEHPSEAVRVDRRSGIRERALFVAPEAGGPRLYVLTHEPADPPVGGCVVICSPILVDQLVNYRREVHLARALATDHQSVARFHYRGTGNSDGQPDQMTLGVIEDDATFVAGWLSEQHPDVPIAVVGTRVGAIAALAVAQAHPSAPMVLIEPIIDLTRYYRDMLRATRIRSVARRAKSESGLPELLARDGYFEAMGDVLHASFYESSIDADPVAALEPGSRPTLVVQLGGREVRADLHRVADRLGALGWSVDTEIVDIDESWWFREGLNDAVQTGITDPVRGWLQRQDVSREAPR